MTRSESWKKKFVKFRRQKELQFFALAGVAYLIIFSIIPMFGIILAFKSYKITAGISGIFTSEWVGLKYFKEFFSDYRFWELLRNTIVLSSLKMIFAFPVPIILAILISECRNEKFKRVIQTASYLPNFVSWVLVYGISTALLSQGKGAINQLLVHMGIIDSGIPFLIRICSGEHQWYYLFGKVRDGGRLSFWQRYRALTKHFMKQQVLMEQGD